MTPRRLWFVAVLVAVALAVVVVVRARDDSGGYQHQPDDPFADYCKVVEQQRGLVAAAVDKGASTGLIAALPSFEVLRAKAPADVADDWDVVVGAIEGLVDALHAAGVEPSTYDRAHPPQGLTQAQRATIDAAATKLDSENTRLALASVDQEARDVCHSPLML
ncbi:hypothetical protein [Nocardioides montaniterrae]